MEIWVKLFLGTGLATFPRHEVIMGTRDIAIFPLLGAGHIYPLLEMMGILKNRGYRIRCIVDERHAACISEIGVEPIVIKMELDERDREFNKAVGEQIKVVMRLPVSHPDWWEMYANYVYPALLRLAENVLLQVVEMFEAEPPSVVIYDRLAFAGRVLAHRLGVQPIQIYPHFAPYKNSIHRENGVCTTPSPMLKFGARLDEFLASHGLVSEGGLWHTEMVNIYFIPKDFQYHSDSFDAQTTFVGACLGRPSRGTWQSRTDGQPVILVSDISHSPAAEYFQTFVDALGNSPWRVVLSLGERVPESAFGTLPDNIELNRRTSHLEILKCASLSICHGGTGTTLEALYHGVPVIALPVTPPTAEIGYRIVELGVGLQLDRRTASPEVIRDAVRGVLEATQIKARVARWQAVFRSVTGAALAADMVERHFRQ